VDPPDAHRGIPAFPFCQVTLRGPKPRAGYPEEPSTLGEHLKKRRLDLGLGQKEVAAEFGANFKSYDNWEQEKHEPEFRYWPAIIGFLGYDPVPEPETFGERIRWRRRREGLTRKELAEKLGLDPVTVWAWEAGKIVRRYPRIARIFEEYVEGE
jgi:transcriptional regulator with XRE-family HTH domain